jgi:cytochrome c553
VRLLARDLLAAPPAGRGAAYGRLLAACADCHATGKSLSVPRLAGVALPDLEDEMDQHYVDALALQLAVVGGDFAWIERSAGALATIPDEPPVAAPHLAEVRAAATRAHAATTVPEAASAVGDLLVACGRCHTASGGGPHDAMEPPPSTEPHMALHVYGAYWMAYGLYAPDERAWTAGADALARGRLAPGDAPPMAGQDEVEARVHALATRAGATTDPSARGALWGELAATCSECHRRLPPK